MKARSSICIALTSLLLCAACNRDTVTSYRVPKEKDPEMPGAASAPSGPAATSNDAGNAMASTAVPTANGSDLSWTAPTRWRVKPPTPMRKGSFAVPGLSGGEADFSITAFPGDVGGELANVNRWRGQVHMAPLAEADLASAVQRVEANGLQFGVVDLAEAKPNGQRILGAFVAHDGATWFFKLIGPDAVVAAAKPEFLAFLQTVKPATPTTR